MARTTRRRRFRKPSAEQLERIVAQAKSVSHAGKPIVRDHFDNWEAFVKCASDPSLIAWTFADSYDGGGMNSCPWNNRHTREWHGTDNMPEAVDLALNGW